MHVVSELVITFKINCSIKFEHHINRLQLGAALLSTFQFPFYWIWRESGNLKVADKGMRKPITSPDINLRCQR